MMQKLSGSARMRRGAWLFSTLPLLMSPALAQEAEHLETGVSSADTLDTVVVTGSRIRSPNVEAVNPITSLSFEHLAATGNTESPHLS